jgi:hypothetical protein
MADEEQKDVTIGVPAADAGAEPVGEDEDGAAPDPEPKPDDPDGE